MQEIEEKFEETQTTNEFHIKQIEVLNRLNSLLYQKSTLVEDVVFSDKLKEAKNVKLKIQEFNEQIDKEMNGFEGHNKENQL